MRTSRGALATPTDANDTPNAFQPLSPSPPPFSSGRAFPALPRPPYRSNNTAYYPRTGVQRAGSLRSLKTRRATLFLPTSELVLRQVARCFFHELTRYALFLLLCTPSLCSRLSHVSQLSLCSSPSPQLPTLCVFSLHLSFFSILTDPFRSAGRANDWYRWLHP
jgi:hypothetical protein